MLTPETVLTKNEKYKEEPNYETLPKMRSLIHYGVRAQKDELVDRPEVEAR